MFQEESKRKRSRALLAMLAGGLASTAGLGAVAAGYLWAQSRDLPDYESLAAYEPPVAMRIFARDGRLIGEFAEEHRVFAPIEEIPQLVRRAFIAAEDRNFYRHKGVDPGALLRATVSNLGHIATGERLVGGSTITQQVAKNILLSNEVTLRRKVREMLLALRMERAFSKERILELYLNEIYLGQRSYGVAAAAMRYFGKSLADLTPAEAAYLAALPKAPNNYHPVRRREAAVERRAYVLRRMVEDGHLTAQQAKLANAAPLTSPSADERVPVGDFFVADIWRDMVARYGAKHAATAGFVVRTTLAPELQALADRVLREGLIAYDRRHGWRGPVARLEAEAGWAAQLAAIEPPACLGQWQLAVVLGLDEGGAVLGLTSGARGRIPPAELDWKRALGTQPPAAGAGDRSSALLRVGDVVPVERLSTPARSDRPVAESAGDEEAAEPQFGLRQIPEVEGALVAMETRTGRVLAMTGGYCFERSQFNRASQAMRQPGSAFKPFVYLAALDHGFSPASIVVDAPVVLKMGDGTVYKPTNYGGDFSGPTTLRRGLEKSRNLMTLRLAQAIGANVIAGYGQRFGIADRMPSHPSTALGAVETTLLRLTSAYAILANGGKGIEPALIERIQDRRGRTLYRRDRRMCPDCAGVDWQGERPPAPVDPVRQVSDPLSTFQLVSMLEGVVERGTGRRAALAGRSIAGKTGTTNDWRDAWFIGFAPHLVTGVWVGFDQPRSLGKHETGGRAAAPIFQAFMQQALQGQAVASFAAPKGITLVRVGRDTGRAPAKGEPSILEAFKLGGPDLTDADKLTADHVQTTLIGTGTGGLY